MSAPTASAAPAVADGATSNSSNSSLAESAPPSSDPRTRLCSSCALDRHESAYSAAQLKKKGKRVCAQCIDRRQQEIAAQLKKDAAVADAKAAANAPSSAGPSASSSAAQSQPPSAKNGGPTSSSCVSCKKSKAKHTCSQCKSHCCSIDCLKKHRTAWNREGGECEIIATMPREIIPEADQLTAHDLTHSLGEIIQSLSGLMDELESKDVSLSGAMLNLRGVRPEMLGILPQLYPPRAEYPWWLTRDPTKTTELQQEVRGLVIQTSLFITTINQLYQVASMPRSDETTLDNFLRSSASLTLDHPSVWSHSSRLGHKLVTLLAYVTRNWPTALLPEERVYARLDKEESGVIPVTQCSEKGRLVVVCIAWTTMQDDGGGRTFKVPMVIHQIVYGSDHSASASYSSGGASLQGRNVNLVLDAKGDIQQDDGLRAQFTPMYIEGFVFTGDTGDRGTSFNTSAFRHWVTPPGFTRFAAGNNAGRLQFALASAARLRGLNVFGSLHSMLFTAGVKYDGELVVPLPRLGVATSCADHAILTQLEKQATVQPGDERAQALFTFIEQSSGQSLQQLKAAVQASIGDSWSKLKNATRKVATLPTSADGSSSSESASAPTLDWLLACSTAKDVLAEATVRYRLFSDFAMHILKSKHVTIETATDGRAVCMLDGQRELRLFEMTTSAGAVAAGSSCRISAEVVAVIHSTLEAARTMDIEPIRNQLAVELRDKTPQEVGQDSAKPTEGEIKKSEAEPSGAKPEATKPRAHKKLASKH